MLPRRIGAFVGASAATAVLAIPSIAHASPYVWQNLSPIGGGVALQAIYPKILAGSYCEEQDAAHTRQIEVGAYNTSGSQYGSWVQFTSNGYRSYAGAYSLHGACRNPHTVAYNLGAYVDYFV